MSDINKVLGRARLLGSGTPIQLRWEGSGDSIHAAALLQDLQGCTYDGTRGGTKIKYHATVNLYEDEDDPIAGTASDNLIAAHQGATSDQTYELWFNVNVTRASRSIAEQGKAHIIFVRNIMLTSGSGDSQTDKGPELQDLHRTALRNRSNSLNGNSQIRLGMSGAPGLTVPPQGQGRGDMEVRHLFSGFGGLVGSAKKGGLSLEGGGRRYGFRDFDKGEVMKNDGTSLGKKRTYYLTFHN